MRVIAIFFLLFASTVANALSYYDGRINTYDPAAGLYYRAIEKLGEDQGFLSQSGRKEAVNINIFDPTTGASTLLFKESQPDGIAIVLFELGFKDGSVEFNAGNFSEHVLNNTAVPRRESKDRLLVGVRNKQRKEYTLYYFAKRGTGLTKVVTFPETAEWHIDVRNSKLRIVQQTGLTLKVESYDW
jgi:hypothetical protein